MLLGIACGGGDEDVSTATRYFYKNIAIPLSPTALPETTIESRLTELERTVQELEALVERLGSDVSRMSVAHLFKPPHSHQ